MFSNLFSLLGMKQSKIEVILTAKNTQETPKSLCDSENGGEVSKLG